MSDIIRLLPDSVANQIAAGEVIQRPSSVVKELVENALDAGSTHVDVNITDAGKTAIQVIDNGKGMSHTDARLAFERHATSKIKEAADLFALRTMGFRGEALASIAAVAQVELRTHRTEDEVGTELLIAGSRVEEQNPSSCPLGSNFIVKNLFYNIPARRKFLKSNQTELNNIIAEFERIVLVNPKTSFTLFHNEAELFNLPETSLKQRIVNVFGKKLNQELLSVEIDTTMAHIYGYVGKPEFARKRGAHQYFFVNGRYMRHPYFHKAIMEAYEHLIPTGEQVSYFVYFEVDPASIDVNIHPTKTEIKFENEQALWQILAAVVREALGKFNAVPTIDFDTSDKPEIPVFADGLSNIQAPKSSYDGSYNPFNTSGNSESYSSAAPRNWQDLYSGLDNNYKEPSSLDMFESESFTVDQSYDRKPEDVHDTKDISPFYFQYKAHYIVAVGKSGLLLIDQHRAHVNVLFHRYMNQLEAHAGLSQRILFPEVLQLSVSESAVLANIMDELTSLGFEINDLGAGSYSISAIPAGSEGLNATELVRNMIHDVIDKEGVFNEEISRKLALSLAKSSAIVTGQVLTNEEMSGLVDDLFVLPTPKYTPDGKKIIVIIPDTDLEKMFK